ncbi:sugar ABC transporter substrate-binding protein [Mycolicibacterium sp.]|uniref:sugar ABC transporter substrate-binding protein n=1 Tax=Mycolicibacterium sp. TaxID=2320850 RepID=UPI003D103D33
MKVAAATGCVVLAGCGNTGTSAQSDRAETPDPDRPVTVGWAYGFENSSIYPPLRSAAVAEAQRLGVELLQGSANSDCNKQIENIQNYLQRQVDAWVFTGVCGSGSSYNALVKEGQAEGALAFSYASVHELADGALSFNDSQAGELVAEDATAWLKKTFDGDYSTFSWALMPCSAVPKTVQARTDVVRDAIVALTGKQPLADKDCALDPEAGYQATQAWLQKEPTLDMVIGLNDAGAVGARRALEQSTTIDRSRIYVAGMDGEPAAVEFVMNNDPYYKFTAALDLVEVGSSVVSVPAGVVRGTGLPWRVFNYTPLSVDDSQSAKAFYDRVFGDSK